MILHLDFKKVGRIPETCIFLNFCINFSEKFEKIRKNFEKMTKFSLKFSKIAFSIDFSTITLINSLPSGGSASEPHANDYF